MTNELMTAKDLAKVLHITESQVKRQTKSDSWPHVRFGGKTIRYRAEHVDAIVALYDQAGKVTPVKGLAGQTAASKRRAS